ncbi:MAG TPA: hypothetical protein VJB12_05775 [Candidatus Nanoarchaeia archaeon]|nr:hypothetical protein [Candidatus Nanoarchaeia archaeon]
MHGRRGQVSLILIIGVAILLVAVLAFQISSKNGQSEERQALDGATGKDAVNVYVEECVKSAGEDAVSLIGLQGGYFEVPDDIIYSEEGIHTSYYFKEGISSVPSIGTIEEELEKAVESFLPLCIGDFAPFREQGIEVSQGIASARVSIPKKGVVVDVFLPLSFEMGGNSFSQQEFRAELSQVRLREVHDAIEEFILLQREFERTVCVSCMIDIGEKYDIRLYGERKENLTFLFIAADNQTMIGNSALYFVFANKYLPYTCSDFPPDADPFFLEDCLDEKIAQTGYALTFGEIPNMSAKAGIPFTFPLEVFGHGVFLSVTPPLFEVDAKSSMISFTPQEGDKGAHTVWITARDIYKNEITRSFALEVE